MRLAFYTTGTRYHSELPLSTRPAPLQVLGNSSYVLVFVFNAGIVPSSQMRDLVAHFADVIGGVRNVT